MGISYEPLKDTLKKKSLVISALREYGIHPRTIAKINKNESIPLEKIERICIALQVPIEEVVRIKIK